MTLLNAAAFVLISSEMAANKHERLRQCRMTRGRLKYFAGWRLHRRASYAKQCRVVLCHATDKQRYDTGVCQ